MTLGGLGSESDSTETVDASSVTSVKWCLYANVLHDPAESLPTIFCNQLFHLFPHITVVEIL